MPSIAIIEDDPAIAQMYRFKFEAEGYDVQTAENGVLGLALSESMKPDIILLDLMMPEPTGFQLCRMLRATATFRFTPIIIVTALDDSDSKVVAFGAGANDYLTKPFRIEDLTGRVNSLLGKTQDEE